MSSRAAIRIRIASALVLSAAFACGAPGSGAEKFASAPRAGATALAAAGGLVLSSPVLLDKTTVVAGNVLRATVTYQNTSSSPISVQHVTIAGRPPGGTNVGGPYADLQPQLGAQTVQPGATLTLAASRTFTSADALGTWYSYVTYQGAGGAWSDSPTVGFIVAPPAPVAQPIAVAVTPSTATTTSGSTVAFTASVTGTVKVATLPARARFDALHP